MLMWNENFATGDKMIDEQHRVLFDTINRLEGLLFQTNPNHEEIEFILGLVTYLESYIKDHFQLEEGCMEQHRCPAHAQNKIAHAQFIARFEEFRRHCRAEGFRLELLSQLHQSLHQWIEQHILRVDIQLKPCLARTAA